MENMLKSAEQMKLQLQSENLEGVPSLEQTSVAAAGTSGTTAAAAPSSSKSTSTQLSDLPDICIAMMLACLSPIEVAKLACVCRSFYDASHSDLVWESFLPPSYHYLLALQPNPPPEFASKKEVFDHLCKPFVTSNRIQVFASLGPKCFLSVCLSLPVQHFNRELAEFFCNPPPVPAPELQIVKKKVRSHEEEIV
jgi:hypothetical protein